MFGKRTEIFQNLLNEDNKSITSNEAECKKDKKEIKRC